MQANIPRPYRSAINKQAFNHRNADMPCPGIKPVQMWVLPIVKPVHQLHAKFLTSVALPMNQCLFLLILDDIFCQAIN